MMQQATEPTVFWETLKSFEDIFLSKKNSLELKQFKWDGISKEMRGMCLVLFEIVLDSANLKEIEVAANINEELRSLYQGRKNALIDKRISVYEELNSIAIDYESFSESDLTDQNKYFHTLMVLNQFVDTKKDTLQVGGFTCKGIEGEVKKLFLKLWEGALASPHLKKLIFDGAMDRELIDAYQKQKNEMFRRGVRVFQRQKRSNDLQNTMAQRSLPSLPQTTGQDSQTLIIPLSEKQPHYEDNDGFNGVTSGIPSIPPMPIGGSPVGSWGRSDFSSSLVSPQAVVQVPSGDFPSRQTTSKPAFQSLLAHHATSRLGVTAQQNPVSYCPLGLPSQQPGQSDVDIALSRNSTFSQPIARGTIPQGGFQTSELYQPGQLGVSTNSRDLKRKTVTSGNSSKPGSFEKEAPASKKPRKSQPLDSFFEVEEIFEVGERERCVLNFINGKNDNEPRYFPEVPQEYKPIRLVRLHFMNPNLKSYLKKQLKDNPELKQVKRIELCSTTGLTTHMGEFFQDIIPNGKEKEIRFFDRRDSEADLLQLSKAFPDDYQSPGELSLKSKPRKITPPSQPRTPRSQSAFSPAAGDPKTLEYFPPSTTGNPHGFWPSPFPVQVGMSAGTMQQPSATSNFQFSEGQVPQPGMPTHTSVPSQSWSQFGYYHNKNG